MKLAIVLAIASTLLGCSRQSTQRLTSSPITAPSGSPAFSSSVSGMVLQDSGGCIEGATAEIVGGQGRGQRITQETPCGYWDYGGGFVFRNLTPDVELTVRAEAPGYVAQERTLRPSPATIFFTLSRIE